MAAAEYYFDGLTLEMVKATARGEADKVAALVKAGADPNARGKEDITPLIWVASYGKNKRGVKALLDNGADPNLEPVKGVTAVMRAVAEPDPEYLQLLLDAGGNPNGLDQNNRPLFETAYYHHWKHMKLLLERGADVNATDSVNNTFILSLAQLSNYEMVYRLLEYGADYQIKSVDGQTVAEWTFNKELNPDSDAYYWQQKCRAWLEARGVKNPGKYDPSPEELNKFLNDLWELGKKNKKIPPRSRS